MANWYARLLYTATILALIVVVMGAWVRLSDAGLGCPDWPGCYGSLIVPETEAHVAEEHQALLERPLETGKAWKEMIHRYAASTLGFIVIFIALFAWLNRRKPDQPVAAPLFLLGLVIFQGLLGMWTVTLLVKPVIVVAHLLGGMGTLALCFWLVLEARRHTSDRISSGSRRAPALAVAGVIVLVFQIALGGWTSSNYAALACPDLPTCHGQWWPDDANFSEGFVLWRGLGVDYEFGVLDAPSRVAIHFTHRIGAIVTLLFLAYISMFYWRRGTTGASRQASVIVFSMLTLQFILGLSVVWFGLPLALASAHNGVAALLLLSMVNLNHQVSLEQAA